MRSLPYHLECGGRPTTGEPRCCDCGRTATEIYGSMDPADLETIDQDTGGTPITHAKSDGTYNPKANRFCCDVCYVRRGCPSAPAPRGWKAP